MSPGDEVVLQRYPDEQFATIPPWIKHECRGVARATIEIVVPYDGLIVLREVGGTCFWWPRLYVSTRRVYEVEWPR